MTDASTSTKSGGLASETISRQNPWLTGILGMGLVLAFIGVLMVGAGGDEYSDGGFTGTQIAGGWLIGAGLTALALWLASAAICWQIKQR